LSHSQSEELQVRDQSQIHSGTLGHQYDKHAVIKSSSCIWLP